MNKGIFRFALRFFSGTMISRVSGLLRDVIMAFLFGATSEVAAFMVAYRLAFLFRRLFGEGLLSQGFIPHFEKFSQESETKALTFFRDVFFTIGCLVLLFSSLFGFSLFFGGRGSIPTLTLFILPGVFFICLYAATMAFLQTKGRFFVPAMAPALANLFWVIGAIAVYFLKVKNPMVYLAGFVSLGFAIQLAVTWIQARPFLRKASIDWWRPHLFSPAFKKAAASLFLGILGVAAIQINSTVDAIFARMALPEGPAFLWYAIRIQQLPLALIGLAISSAFLPSLSRETEHFIPTLRKGIELTFFLIFPCSVALFVLAEPGVSLLYGHGGFHGADIQETVKCLWGYGVGLLPAALIQIYCQGFYARKDYRTPAVGFALSAGINVALDVFFIFGLGLGPESVAYATSIAAIVNFMFLFSKMPLPLPYKDFSRIIAGSLIAGGITLWTTHLFVAGTLFGQLLSFGVQGCLFIGLFLAICKLVRVPIRAKLQV